MSIRKTSLKTMISSTLIVGKDFQLRTPFDFENPNSKLNKGEPFGNVIFRFHNDFDDTSSRSTFPSKLDFQDSYILSGFHCLMYPQKEGSLSMNASIALQTRKWI